MTRNYSNAAKLIIILFGLLPLASMAQNNGDREFYLRPSYWRPYDQRGINVFETSKTPDSIPFEGLRLRLGAGFTQQFQNLTQSNNFAINNGSSNRLVPVTPGFMTAQANLYTDVQLAPGIRLNVTTYLSARHHNEAWVKGGYIQFDKLPFKGQFWTNLMNIATIKVGHMEINYGDAHFRRSDGGQTLYNPFMDNYIVDGYTTEIGGEIYLQKNGLFGMIGLTNGMIKGNVDSTYPTAVDPNTKRAPSIYAKAGIDKQLSEKVRVRLSGSVYHNSSSAASGLTLYWGDRTGSNYQNVMELAGFAPNTAGKTMPATTSIPWSGRVNPAFTKRVDALMLNGFIKAGGLELFGTYEHANGRTSSETTDRNMDQLAADVVYRFGKAENLFVGLRGNTVTLGLIGFSREVTVNRVAAAAGWFVTRNVLLKGELVNQEYVNFNQPKGGVQGADYRSGGRFKGYVIEAVVGF